MRERAELTLGRVLDGLRRAHDEGRALAGAIRGPRWLARHCGVPFGERRGCRRRSVERSRGLRGPWRASGGRGPRPLPSSFSRSPPSPPLRPPAGSCDVRPMLAPGRHVRPNRTDFLGGSTECEIACCSTSGSRASRQATPFREVPHAAVRTGLGAPGVHQLMTGAHLGSERTSTRPSI